MNIQGYGTIFRRTSKRNNEYWVLRMKQKEKDGEEKWYGMLVRYNKSLDNILRNGTSLIDENGNHQDKPMNLYVKQGWIKFWQSQSGNINPYLFLNDIETDMGAERDKEDSTLNDFQDDTNPFDPVQTVEYPPASDNFERPGNAAVDMTAPSHTMPVMDDEASDGLKQFRANNIG